MCLPCVSLCVCVHRGVRTCRLLTRRPGVNLSHGALYTKRMYSEQGELHSQQILPLPSIDRALEHNVENMIEVEVEVDMRRKPYRIGFGLPEEPMIYAEHACITCNALRPWAYLWGDADALVLLPRRRPKAARMQPYKHAIRQPLSFRPGHGTGAYRGASHASAAALKLSLMAGSNDASQAAEPSGAEDRTGRTDGQLAARSKLTAAGACKPARRMAEGASAPSAAEPRGRRPYGPRRASGAGVAGAPTTHGGAAAAGSTQRRQALAASGSAAATGISNAPSAAHAPATASAGSMAAAINGVGGGHVEDSDMPGLAPPARGMLAVGVKAAPTTVLATRLARPSAKNGQRTTNSRSFLVNRRPPPPEYTYWDDHRRKKEQEEPRSRLFEFSLRYFEQASREGLGPKRHPWDRARPVTRTYADFFRAL